MPARPPRRGVASPQRPCLLGVAHAANTARRCAAHKPEATLRCCATAGEGPVAERKTCSGCGIEKPGAEFTRDTRARDGLQSRCKECTSRYFAAWSAQRRAAMAPPAVAWKACGACGAKKPAEVSGFVLHGRVEGFPRCQVVCVIGGELLSCHLEPADAACNLGGSAELRVCGMQRMSIKDMVCSPGITARMAFGTTADCSRTPCINPRAECQQVCAVSPQ